MGQHLINRRFQPTVPRLTNDQVPQGRHISPLLKGGGGLYAPPKDGEIPTGICPPAEGAYSRNVPSLRDLVRRLPCRRLKPTVNKISSLRDWIHYFLKCSNADGLSALTARGDARPPCVAGLSALTAREDARPPCVAGLSALTAREDARPPCADGFSALWPYVSMTS